MLKNILISGVFLSFSSQIFAEETPTESHENEFITQTQFGFTAGLTFGGEELGGLYYEDGDSAEISAGGLMAIGAALRSQHTEQFLSKFTANYHFDNVSATNADVSFSRITLEALAGLRANETVTFYGGLTYHLSPTYTEKMDYHGSNKVEFDSSLGFVIEAAFNISENSEVSARYVLVDYEFSSLNGYDVGGSGSVDGNHFGIYYTGYF